MTRPTWLHPGARVRFSMPHSRTTWIVTDVEDEMEIATLRSEVGGTATTRYAVLEAADAIHSFAPISDCTRDDLIGIARGSHWLLLQSPPHVAAIAQLAVKLHRELLEARNAQQALVLELEARR